MLLSVLIIAICMALFCVKVIFKKNGKFSSQHVHDNPGLRKQGIHCVVDQDAADDLEKLAGVGRKTANVIRAVWFGHATMAVDTHVYRVSHRMGLVPKTADTPRKVEDYLMKHIPAEDIPNAHHWILLHGRYICKSTKPLCDKCFFNEYCPKLLKDSKL